MQPEASLSGFAGKRRTLTGPEKVGVMLLALGQERASALLKKFDVEELNIIMRSTDAIPTISTPELLDIVNEFQIKLAQGLPFVGTGEEVRRLVNGVIVENRSASANAGQIEERPGIWVRLPALPDDVLFPFLSRQHPQISAYLLNKLGAERSSTLLRRLEGDQRNDMLGRILALRPVSPVIVEGMEQSIQEELFDADKGASDKHVVIAGILNNFEKSETSDSLTYLSNLRPKDAEAIRKLLFKFEDLIKLSPKALTVLMDGIPVERVVLALQGAQAEFQQKVLMALAPRARRMAEAELQSGSTANPRDVAESRRVIVDAVLKLVADNTIELAAAASADA